MANDGWRIAKQAAMVDPQMVFALVWAFASSSKYIGRVKSSDRMLYSAKEEKPRTFVVSAPFVRSLFKNPAHASRLGFKQTRRGLVGKFLAAGGNFVRRFALQRKFRELAHFVAFHAANHVFYG